MKHKTILHLYRYYSIYKPYPKKKFKANSTINPVAHASVVVAEHILIWSLTSFMPIDSLITHKKERHKNWRNACLRNTCCNKGS